jgi:hypothetical protein
MILLRPEHASKALSPILVKLLGRMILLRPEKEKALPPILVTLLGISTLVRPPQDSNA